MNTAFSNLKKGVAIDAGGAHKIVHRLLQELMCNGSFTFAVENGLLKICYQDQQLLLSPEEIKAVVHEMYHQSSVNPVEKQYLRLAILMEYERCRLCGADKNVQLETETPAAAVSISNLHNFKSISIDGKTFVLPRVEVVKFLHCLFCGYHEIGQNVHLLTTMLYELLNN
jgi:hypothetical protein